MFRSVERGTPEEGALSKKEFKEELKKGKKALREKEELEKQEIEEQGAFTKEEFDAAIKEGEQILKEEAKKTEDQAWFYKWLSGFI